MEKRKIDQLLDFLRETPHDLFLKYALALEHVKINNFNTAILYMEEVLKADENYLPAYYQLGKIYENIQNKDRAINLYIKGMEVANNNNNKHAFSELKQALDLLKESSKD